MNAPSAELPAPTGSPYRIALVCLGNICRSPMAHVVLSELVDRAGLSEAVEVSSSGTGGWHVGNPMDRRAAAALLAADYDPSDHRAQQFDASWFDNDLVLAMDEDNLGDLLAQRPDATHVRLFRDFDPLGTGPVPDPYYGDSDGFAEVLAIAERTSIAIVAALERLLLR